MLSSASKYAVNAVLYLAIASTEENKASIKEISEAIGAPSPFLAKQLQVLARNDYVSSTKGPGGGFYLTDENKKVKLIQIVDCIDGLTKFNTCALGLKACNKRKPCPIHEYMETYRTRLLKNLSEHSVEELAEGVRDGKTFLID